MPKVLFRKTYTNIVYKYIFKMRLSSHAFCFIETDSHKTCQETRDYKKQVVLKFKIDVIVYVCIQGIWQYNQRYWRWAETVSLV